MKFDDELIVLEYKTLSNMCWRSLEIPEIARDRIIRYYPLLPGTIRNGASDSWSRTRHAKSIREGRFYYSDCTHPLCFNKFP
eukprot:1384043-Amorphochlora_amoeboformis.AAC.1